MVTDDEVTHTPRAMCADSTGRSAQEKLINNRSAERAYMHTRTCARTHLQVCVSISEREEWERSGECEIGVCWGMCFYKSPSVGSHRERLTVCVCSREGERQLGGRPTESAGKAGLRRELGFTDDALVNIPDLLTAPLRQPLAHLRIFIIIVIVKHSRCPGIFFLPPDE